MTEQFDYGDVVFVSGKYKGRTGNYDDDECEKAIVYLDPQTEKDNPLQYVVVSYKSITRVDNVHNFVLAKRVRNAKEKGLL